MFKKSTNGTLSFSGSHCWTDGLRVNYFNRLIDWCSAENSTWIIDHLTNDTPLDTPVVLVTDYCDIFEAIYSKYGIGRKFSPAIVSISSRCNESSNAWKLFMDVDRLKNARQRGHSLQTIYKVLQPKFLVSVLIEEGFEDLFNTKQLLKLFSKHGCLTTIYKIRSNSDLFVIMKSISSEKQTMQVYVLCSRTETSKTVKMASSFGLFTRSRLSWVIYVTDWLSSLKESLDNLIRYDTKMLIVHQKYTDELIYDLKYFIEVIMLRIPGTWTEQKTCDKCEEMATMTAIYRIAYQPGIRYNFRLECTARWDLWLQLEILNDYSIWGPQFTQMTGIHFNITTVFKHPSIDRRPQSTCSVVNSRDCNDKMDVAFKYEGYLANILHLLQDIYNFTYTISESPDKAYGVWNNGKWNGVIGELVTKRADIALVTLDYQGHRAAAVDYLSTPVLYHSAKMIFRKPAYSSTDFYLHPWRTMYIKPFEATVWMFMLFTTVLCALVLTLIELSYETTGSGPANTLKPYNTFTNPFDNLMYMYQTIVQQGWDVTPDRIPSRVVVISFTIYSIMMYAGYAGVLVSHFVVSGPPKPFESLSDLASNSLYKIGTVDNTSHVSFFRDSRSKFGRQIWNRMKSDEQNLVSTTQELLNRIMTTNFVGIEHDEDIDYLTSTNCSFVGLSDDMLPRHIPSTIALRKNSPYTEALSNRLRILSETGILKRTLDNFLVSDICAQKTNDDKNRERASVKFEDVVVPCLIMVSGLSISMVMTMVETLCAKWRRFSLKERHRHVEDDE
ncbi:Uncharacterised protein g1764 [Pycnogonum litorale]